MLLCWISSRLRNLRAVGQELRPKNMPFVILTGYEKSAALPSYDEVPVISRPPRSVELSQRSCVA
jgi:hypothetical protein